VARKPPLDLTHYWSRNVDLAATYPRAAYPALPLYLPHSLNPLSSGLTRDEPSSLATNTYLIGLDRPPRWVRRSRRKKQTFAIARCTFAVASGATVRMLGLVTAGLVTVSRIRRPSVCCGSKLSFVVRPGVGLLYFGTCHTLEIEVVTQASLDVGIASGSFRWLRMRTPDPKAELRVGSFADPEADSRRCKPSSVITSSQSGSRTSGLANRSPHVRGLRRHATVSPRRDSHSLGRELPLVTAAFGSQGFAHK